MKVGMTKNKIIIAAVIVCILAAAWVYGGNNSQRAAVQENNPVAGTGLAGGEKGGVPQDTPDVLDAPNISGAGSDSSILDTQGVSDPPDALGAASVFPAGSGMPPANAAKQAAETREITVGGSVQEQSAGKTPGLTTDQGTMPGPAGMEGQLAERKGGQDAGSANTGKSHSQGVPEGSPLPAGQQGEAANTGQELTCRLSVSCTAIFDNLELFHQDKSEVLPADGVIYASRNVVFYEGESVFDVLQREMKKHKIHLKFNRIPLYNSLYIEGINNICEFDCGELSGWMCRVNDRFLSYGSSSYLLQNGDVIEWLYTCDLGRDLGEEWLGRN